MYVKSKNYVNLYLREKKNGLAYYTRLWYPPKKNSVYIKLGDKTKVFEEEHAFEKIIYIKEQFKLKDYDYHSFLKNYGKPKEEIKQYTLNEIAEKYFDSVFNRMKTDFLDIYKDRYNIKNEEDLLNNQVFKNKKKAFNSSKNYYTNHYKVKEWNLVQEMTKRPPIKPKEKLTKKGIKSLNKIPEKNINDIQLDEILDMINPIKENMNISQKTKHNIISLLKTIFIFAKRYKYLKYNHFEDIDKKTITRNPHNYRKRILDIPEVKELFQEFKEYAYEDNKPNVLNSSILALATGARANTILNIRKSDFKLKENMTQENFNDVYYSVKLINFKTQNTYELPLHEKVGRYFYYLLKDYQEEEYVLRHSKEDKRELKPLAEIPKQFREICERTVNANKKMKDLYKWVREDINKINSLYKYNLSLEHKTKAIKESENENLLIFIDKNNEIIEKNIERIKRHEKQININLLSIDKEKELRYKSHEEYLSSNFSFHNFRHQLVSLCSVINPLYAKRILNHSSERKDATTDKYIKSELPEIKKVIEKALNPYLEFIEELITDIQEKLETNFEKEKSNFVSKLNVEEFKTVLEKTRDINTFELYDNEYILFQIMEDKSLTETERYKALLKFEEEKIFDKKYLK